MRARFACGVSVVALTSVFAGQVYAQEGRGAAADTAAVEEVVVTAQRREERLMDVPLSITAVTERQLQDAGAVTTRDLSQLSPGLTSTTNGRAFQPAVRGITTTGTSAGDESNIAMYLDGVYLAAQGSNVLTLKSIERIEVLKGPQGTLFGRNATGGAIRIITKDPGSEPELQATFSYGTKLKSREANAYVATPVTDTLSVGVNASVYDDEGYIKHMDPNWTGGKFGTTHSWMTRAKAVWRPVDELKVTLSGDMSRFQSDTQFALAPLDGLNALRNSPGALIPDEPWEISSNLKPSINVRGGGVGLTVEYELPRYTLTSITGYRTHSLYGFLDNDRINIISSVAVTGDTFKWFTQEGLIASNYEGPLNFVAGLYYFASESSAQSDSYVSGPILVNGALSQLGTLTSEIDGYVDTRSWAAFGDATWEATNALKLIAGLRYTVEKKELRTVSTRPVRPTLTDEKEWDNWSYRLTAQYDFAEDSNVYASYSTGFKTGQYQAASATFVQRVDPETVKAFEVGIKSRIAGFIDVTAAAFHYKYDNIQVQSNNFITGQNLVILTNAAKATVTGMDGEIVARVNRNLRITLGAAWLPTAQYDQFPGALDSVPKGFPGSLNPALCPGPQCGLGNDQIIRDVSGTRMIRSPEFTFNAGVMYDHELAGGTLNLVANYFHTSEFFWVTGEHIAQPAYDLVNASIGWTSPSERYRFTLFGRNLTNAEYGVYNSPNAQGVAVAWAAPREIGVRLDLNF